MPRHTTIQNVEYWKKQVVSWFEHRTTKDGYEVVGICGNVVIELGDSWLESHAQAARDDMITHNIPVDRIEDTKDNQLRIRVKATDKRLVAPIE